MAAKKSSNCNLCGQRLIGTFLTYDNGLVVCSDCNTTVPHCSLCGIPSRQLIAVRVARGQGERGEQVCTACLQKLPVCACCNIPILKEFTIIGSSSAPYCQSCMTTRPRCGICRVPLNDQGKTIREEGGNVYRCASCYRTAVTTGEEAQQLYEKTRSLLKHELNMDIPLLPELHVVEWEQLAVLHRQNSRSGPAETSVEGGPQHLLGFFKRVGEKQDIYIEQVLPRMLFQAVAAHELAHAWQSINAPLRQPDRIVEGFAEWVAYHVLLALGQQAEAARLTRRNDLYGEGLQYFLHLERESGRAGVLRRAVQ